jgi:NodT family efflux transporter outer membrane factor (OMF) lipoprotein
VQKVGRYTPEGAGNASTEITPGRPVPTHVTSLGVGVEAAWEVDAWGRLRNARSGAVARWVASVEGTHFVVSSLVAEVATSYFELLALDLERGVFEQSVARQQEALEVVRLQMQAGRANELAVQQFAAQLANTKALAAENELRIRETESLLNLLRGAYSAPVQRSTLGLLAEVPPLLTSGVPSALLRNRPDVRAAEADIEATKFDLAAARAAFFPSLTLSAGVGFEAFNPRYLLSTPESLAYSAAGGLVAPLVNRSGIQAQFDAAKALQIQAMYQYQKVVLEAYAEVVNALTKLSAGARLTALRRERKSAVAQTVESADALYRAGKASYFEVLLAQQNTLSAELELITALKEQHVTSVRLYRALGGGWR